MPNGRIFLVVAADYGNLHRWTFLLELDQKTMKLELNYQTNKHFNFKGAVASIVNEIFVTGS